MTRIQALFYFDSEIREIDKVCLDAHLAFFSVRASCEEMRYAMKWYPMRMCTR